MTVASALHQLDAVMFDFDYTLADSSPGVVECARYALMRMGMPPVARARVCETIGLSLPDTYRVLTGQADAAAGAAFARLFVERAEQVMAGLTTLFPAVPALVDWLRRAGLARAIVSTKFRRRIEEVLSREGLLDAFHVIVGGEDVRAHKPDPSSLLLAAERLGARHALYVGDSVTDARAAERAGIPFVAVLSGPTDAAAFAPHPICGILSGVDELPRWIDERAPWVATR